MRLFFALIPSDAMMDLLRAPMFGVGGARWQTNAQLHLTLRFVGDVSQWTADDLARALPGLVDRLPPIAFSGVGFFETKGHPNSLWVRAIPKEPLARLHQKLDRACQAVGLDAESRAYIPHVTLARLSRSVGPITQWINANAGFATPPMPFARCSLMESIATDSGSHYEEIAWITLD